VFEQWGGEPDALFTSNHALLTNIYELALLQRLVDYPEIVEAAARELSPHLIAYYLRDLASELHSYYNAEQFLVPDEALKLARLSLVASTRHVLCSGLNLLGVSCPEKM
jgi:arginyl-tRNA synthetase